ncbi:hypothetical protein [Cohnella zeiphila]|uniref:Uncharacterized protein n=1 Tax=Cohnella zeiphila TaxID=2761120 RepID=A0A7X0ST90_9BACL|nr:hypothetical protein [Cohnella zeiphila]MBB6733473.1 hypothetical protein [Cohnella zeiphila]
MESGMKQPAPAGNRLSKDASLTLVLQGLFTFAYALSNTFLNLLPVAADTRQSGLYRHLLHGIPVLLRDGAAQPPDPKCRAGAQDVLSPSYGDCFQTGSGLAQQIIEQAIPPS